MIELTKPTVPIWGGPVNEGISQSIINGFDCPFRAYLNLILGLKDNLPLHPNLIWGDCYHVGLEHLIKGESLTEAKSAALARIAHHNKDPLSDFPVRSYEATITSMLAYYDLSILPSGNWETEVQFEVNIPSGYTFYKFRGKLDGLLENQCIVEHKCKGFYGVDPDLLAEEIEDNLQLNLYMTIVQVETVYYDLIGIPESINFGAPYKARNADEYQYGISLIYGGAYKPTKFFPVKDNTHIWFSQRPYFISQEVQSKYWERTIIPKVKRIHEWYDYVTSNEFDPNNPDCYNHIFYQQPVRNFIPTNTEKFKCDYHAYLTGQATLSSLKQTHTVFQELAQPNEQPK